MKPIRILSLTTTGLTALGLIMACSAEPTPGPGTTSGGAPATSGGAAATSGGAAQTSGGAPATSGGAAATSGGAAATSGGAAATTGGSGGGATATGGSAGASPKGGSGGAGTTGGAAGAGTTGGSGGAATTGGTAGAGTTGGSAGAATGGSGGGGTFSPICGKNMAGVDIKKDTECTSTDVQLCYRTCGVETKGFKKEECMGGKYAEGACQFPAGDYACYKLPATADASCPTMAAMAPQHNQACTVAACTVCGGTSAAQTTGYKDSGGAAKVGYCVCSGSKWQCASDKEWPCPAGTGCQ